MIDEQEAKKTHPGFTIICDACGSKVVIVDNTLGFSATSGAWGGISLFCQECEALCELTERSMQDEAQLMQKDVAAGAITIETFTAKLPRADLWPLPFAGPRMFRVDPPLTVHFRVLTEEPADHADGQWWLPCIVGEFDPGLGEMWRCEDFPYPMDYSDRTGSTRKEVVKAITDHIGFHYQTAESEALYGGDINYPDDVAQARHDLAHYWQRIQPVNG